MSSRNIAQQRVRLFAQSIDRSFHHAPRAVCVCMAALDFPQPLKRKRQRLGALQKRTYAKIPTFNQLPRKNVGPVDERRTIDQVDGVLNDILKTIQSPVAPSETGILKALSVCEDLAKYSKKVRDSSETQGKLEATPAENLLFLDERDGESEANSHKTAAPAAAEGERVMDRLSKIVHTIISSPNVFITPKILDTYVRIQSLLKRPETLAEAFELYANKPIQTPGTSRVKYSVPNPNKVSAAVPLKIATAALQAAIQAEDLVSCFDIIKSTTCKPAFRRSKFVRRALLPLSGLSLAPLAAYTIASQLADYQDTMSKEMATNVVFAGLLSYVCFTSVLGMVAITTANDQMDRVTWADGTPLRDRWIREEERAMVDQVAIAWGFRRRDRRGEEEGVEWEAIKEFAGLRRMIVDRVSLMDNME